VAADSRHQWTRVTGRLARQPRKSPPACVTVIASGRNFWRGRSVPWTTSGRGASGPPI
jgi:hypothetical protein